MPAVITAIVLVVLALALVFNSRRRRPSGRLEGVEGFRRHMDALSSEARRNVIDRVQQARRDEEED